MSDHQKIGFSGSCHWCTEAIFQSLNGVDYVEQGWVSIDGESKPVTEGVIVAFNPAAITLDVLVAVHLHTHSCTSNHEMRSKYRSAIYYYSSDQMKKLIDSIKKHQNDFELPIVTEILPLLDFRINEERYLNYYIENPERPFCQTYIDPKLRLLLQRFTRYTNVNKLIHLIK